MFLIEDYQICNRFGIQQLNESKKTRRLDLDLF